MTVAPTLNAEVVAHTAGFASVAIWSFRPTPKSKRRTPMSAIQSMASDDSMPKACRTNPAIRNPTSGGSFTALATKPRARATSSSGTSIGALSQSWPWYR